MSDLDSYRVDIDRIDNAIVELFKERMSVSEKIGEYKRANGLPVLDRERERQKLFEVSQHFDDDLKNAGTQLFSLLMEASRAHQHATSKTLSSTLELIDATRSATAEFFPQQAFVACQGVEGAYSQIAAERLFKHPNIIYFESWDAVFKAIDEQMCRYGVIPLENSSAGTVNAVYDLMMNYDFNIVRTLRLKVDHSLLTRGQTDIDKLAIVYSHPQAIEQCSEFLAAHPQLRVHICDNTAVAAKRVAESERDDVCALSSRSCAEIYGLTTLAQSVQNNSNNYTRFACISKEPEIYPGADRTSLMMIVSHEPGSLYKVLSLFHSLEINLVKLESRPIPERDFEFMFYFDLECPVASPEFRTLLNSLDEVCEQYRYLGSYQELV
ncbi:MAG: chorismate mutase [Atopobiaceae bacterium]|nr:chorismate mutase [Atopobiaceae bacterium]